MPGTPIVVALRRGVGVAPVDVEGAGVFACVWRGAESFEALPLEAVATGVATGASGGFVWGGGSWMNGAGSDWVAGGLEGVRFFFLGTTFGSICGFSPNALDFCTICQ